MGLVEAEYDTERQKRIKHLGRILVFLGIVGSLVGLSWLLLWLIDSLNAQTNNVHTVEAYFLKAFLPNLVCGFVLFAFGD